MKGNGKSHFSFPSLNPHDQISAQNVTPAGDGLESVPGIYISKIPRMAFLEVTLK
jgi:hypothetical protein